MDDQPGRIAGRNKEDSKVTVSQLNVVRKNREGMTTTSRRGIVSMKEVYCLYDIDNDGVDERCLLIYNAETMIPVRFMEYPYEHGEWPYIAFFNEITDGRLLSSRGLGEILNDIDNVITQNHRNKLNSMQIANMPTFKYRLGSNFNPGQMKWIPGQFVPVMGMNDFEQIDVRANDFSFDNEELNLKFWGENLVGSFDTAFRQQKSEARSAREVAAIQGIQQASQSLRISRFQRAAKRMYNQIWGLWMQYGPENYTLHMSDGKLRHYSKHEIHGQFDLVPVGTVGNTNPEVEAIRARETVTFLVELAQVGLLEVAAQKFNIDIGAAVKDVLDKTDFVTSQRIMQDKPPEQLQAEAQAAQQQQAQQQQQAAIEANQPVPIADLQAQIKQMAKDSPNGGAQRISL